MQRLSEYFYQKTTIWVVFICLALFLLFLVMILPTETTRAEPILGTTQTPDTLFYYSKAQLFQMAEEYGQEGRYYYVDSRVAFDIIWPFIYAIFLINSISWFLGKTVVEESKLRFLNLVPLLGILFDFLENISNMVVMFRYPQRMELLASLAGVFTSLKWVFVGGSFLILIFAILLWVAVKVNIIKT